MKTAVWLTRLSTCVAVLGAVMVFGSPAEAQGLLSFAGQAKAAFPQSRIAEPIAAIPRLCTSISSKSRRCYFTFYKACEKRGESKEHCARMSGFCHACTDAYSACKGDANRANLAGKTPGIDCSTCNVAYDRCIVRLVDQYGGKLVQPK